MKFREEKDSLGSRKVPASAYYGVQTVRALENFQVTGIPISHYYRLLDALAFIKEAAALVNFELGLLSEELMHAIVVACQQIRTGKFNDQFLVDVIQGGAGTSINMNMNEVIANIGLEILGKNKGEYKYLHPNNHVNLSQSTNDVYPTAIRLAAIWYGQELAQSLEELKESFLAKGEEFKDILKMGRTQLQDAVPITLGQEFTAYGITIGEDIERLQEALTLLQEINLGGTAIGTGINTLPEYAPKVVEKLRELTGLPLKLSPNLIEATSDTGALVQLSGILKRIAVKISKICNDLRLLSSGPFAGFREINLPPVQPGSSIMPGKVNPVIPEMMNQICYQVIGNDLTITIAAEAGQLELNVFEPIMSFNLFQSMEMLKKGSIIFREKCIQGITANKEHCLEMVKKSSGLATALVPCLGYELAAQIAKEAQQKNKSIYELVLEKDLLTEKELEDLLDPQQMTCPRPLNLRGKKY